MADTLEIMSRSSKEAAAPRKHAAPVPLALPNWLRRGLPPEITATATSVGEGRIWLVLSFPDRGNITCELQSSVQSPLRRGFTVGIRNEGSGSPEQETIARRTLETRLQHDAKRVVSWMQHARRLSLLANGADDPSLAPAQPRLRKVWSVLRLLDAMESGREDEARAALDVLEQVNADVFLSPHLSLLRFASADALSGMALAARSTLDDDIVGVVIQGIRAGLVGDSDGVRTAGARLAAQARRNESEADGRLLIVAGTLMEKANDFEAAWTYRKEGACATGRPGDIISSWRLLLLLNQQEAFQEHVRNLLRTSRGFLREGCHIGSLCETFGDYELATEAYRRCLESEEPNDSGPAQTESRLALARLAVWRWDAREAMEHLDALGTGEKSVAAARLRAIVAFIEGTPERTLSILDEVEATSPSSAHDAEHQLWRAEALVALGRFNEAVRAGLYSHHIGHGFAQHLIHPLIAARRSLESTFSGLTRMADGLSSKLFRQDSTPMLDVLCEMLSGVVAPEVLVRLSGDLRLRLRTLEKLKNEMGGNRGARPTRLVTRPGERTRMVNWDVRPDARQAAVSLLSRLTVEDPATLLSEFRALGERFPRSPFPYTYQGELRLWLGDYSGAVESFNEALRRKSTRWAYIGLAAASLYQGDLGRANGFFRAGAIRFKKRAAATTYVYRGEMRRLRGDFKGALADLELAVSQRPSRVAARMNLGLTYAALHRPRDAQRELRRAFGEVPGFFFLAAKSLGREMPLAFDIASTKPVVERALELMKGNRSSFLYSLVDDAGTLRVLPLALHFTDVAKRNLWMSEQALLGKLDAEAGRGLVVDGSESVA